MGIIDKIFKMLNISNLEDVSDFQPLNDDEDLDAPNIFVGKLIGNSRLEVKILSIDDGNMTVEITKLKDISYERYLDLGKVYPLIQHKDWEGDLLLWEIESKSMKRNVSQLFLQWEEDLGWNWELDT